MQSIIKEFSEKISSRKSFWIPLLFYTFGSYGFSMLNRTVGADDLATPLYVDGTVWLSELRWGAVLWKKLFSFGACVPFLDKFLSVCFLMLAGTAFSCLLFSINGKKDRVWLYTVAACSFITFPIICEIWEFTCGGTLIVPGDFFCTFLLLLWLQTTHDDESAHRGRGNPLTLLSRTRTLLWAGVLLTPVISSAESIAPVYVATVLMILFYRYCVRRTTPDHKAAWLFEGIRFAIPLIIAFILRLVIGYGIMAALHLQYKHTGATRIAWPLSAEQIADLFKGVLIDYGVAALINLPITIFIVCAVLFAARCILLAVRRRSILPIFLGICTGLSLFLITLIQGTVMYYRTAITLMVFCAFVFYLHAEDFYNWINAGILSRRRLPVLAGRCGIVLLLFIAWRQAAHLHRFLALNNQRYDNEAAVMQQIGYTLTTEYDTEKPLIFVGDFSNGDAFYNVTHDIADTRRGMLYRRIRNKIDGTALWKSPSLVQTTVSSAIDWYHWEFDGQLMGQFLAYYGYDFDVRALSRKELEPYNQEALDLGMKPFQILDRGEYLLVCVGRL
ncbi:MAG: glucosyltransferase domain-containing protein [Eubacteriales bacterium]|nr:glucosyltransferase domain-containing protein [Eubacteriales bacterium]